MKVHVNSEIQETSAVTVESLLQKLSLLPSQVAVEHNGTVLFRHELAQAHLQEGDRIEIVRVVAGG